MRHHTEQDSERYRCRERKIAAASGKKAEGFAVLPVLQYGSQLRAILISYGGFRAGAFENDLFQKGGDRGTDIADRRERAVQGGGAQSRKELEQCDAETVYIGTSVGPGSGTELLRGGITGGPQRNCIRLIRSIQGKISGAPEIDELQTAVRIHQQIPGFHIAVNDRRILGVQIDEDLTDLQSETDSFLFAHRAFPTQEMPQGSTFYIVADDQKRGALASIYDLPGRGKSRMMEPAEEFSFEQERTPCGGDICDILAKLLDHALFPGASVECEIDAALTALPDQGEDLISAGDRPAGNGDRAQHTSACLTETGAMAGIEFSAVRFRKTAEILSGSPRCLIVSTSALTASLMVDSSVW